MLVAMTIGASEDEIAAGRGPHPLRGPTPHESRGLERVVIGVVGDVGPRKEQVMNRLLALPGVDSVTTISRPFKLASRELHPEDTVIRVRDAVVGDGGLTIMGGPCSVESRAQIIETAQAVRAAGATVLRGGAYKPRTSPYSFQGLGVEGLRYLAEARDGRVCRSSRRSWSQPTWASWRSTRTSSRSVPATCRTTRS